MLALKLSVLEDVSAIRNIVEVHILNKALVHIVVLRTVPVHQVQRVRGHVLSKNVIISLKLTYNSVQNIISNDAEEGAGVDAWLWHGQAALFLSPLFSVFATVCFAFLGLGFALLLLGVVTCLG